MRPNIAALRGAIGPMLTETGSIERWTGEYADLDGDGLEEKVYETVFSGPCLIRPEGVDLATIGDATFTRKLFDVTLPADADAVINDVLTVNTCPWDAALVGHRIKLLDVPLDSWQVARFCKGETTFN